MTWLKKIVAKLLISFATKSKGKNNKIISSAYYVLKNKFILQGNNNVIEIGENCRIKGTRIFIHGDNNHVIIGKGVSINNGDFWVEDDNNTIEIDEQTCFTARFHMACMEGTRIAIGKKCLFAADVTIRSGDSHSILNKNGERINQSKDIILKDDIWVGHGATINKGVLIEEHSVVAARAIVTKQFNQGNVVIGGMPAKILKQNISWCGDKI